jgi:hypothetical protein
MVDFTPTEAEQKVLDGAREGAPTDFRTGDRRADELANGATWGPERQIRADILWQLCTGATPRWSVHPKGVTVFGARITGQLDLEGAALICRLSLFDCAFEHVILLSDARTRTISLAGSHIPGLTGDRIEINGTCFLNNGFRANGEVRLPGATISGDLVCRGATLSNPNSCALLAEEAKVDGTVHLDNGFHAQGEVLLSGAVIGGDLACGGARLSNSQGHALSADRTKVGGGVYLDEGFHAEGEVRLLGAEIGGSLTCNGATFSMPGGNALSADRAKIGENVYLEDFKASGAVRFPGANIGGDFYCIRARINDGANGILLMQGVTVKGGMMLTDMNEPPTGGVNLNHARVGSLIDDRASWPVPGYLILLGLTYGSIGGPAPVDWKARLDWLRRQPSDEFHPQPYEQLVQVLRTMGHERDAREIAIAKREDLRRWGELSHWERAWNWFLGKTIGHGYRPWKALVWGAFVVAFGVMFFKDAERYDVMVPTDARVYLSERWTGSAKDWLPREYPPFNPWLYSLDVFLPIVDFHEKGYWEPRENSANGAFIKVYSILHIIAGWVLTTLAVAGFSGLVKKD